MRTFITALALACTMALSMATGAMAQTNQSGLVNVNVDDNVVQVPIAIAANICGVTVAVLANALEDGEATCDALAASGATVTPREPRREHATGRADQREPVEQHGADPDRCRRQRL